MSKEKKKHPTIALKACDSSQVAEYGYDADSQTLAVKFHNGGLYHYEGVNAKSLADFEAAKSKGKHLAAHIRGSHKFAKIS